MLDKEKACTACSGFGYYCGRACGACNGTGLEYSKDDIIEALEAELKKLQNKSPNSDYAREERDELRKENENLKATLSFTTLQKNDLVVKLRKIASIAASIAGNPDAEGACRLIIKECE